MVYTSRRSRDLQTALGGWMFARQSHRQPQYHACYSSRPSLSHLLQFQRQLITLKKAVLEPDVRNAGSQSQHQVHHHVALRLAIHHRASSMAAQLPTDEARMIPRWLNQRASLQLCAGRLRLRKKQTRSVRRSVSAHVSPIMMQCRLASFSLVLQM